MTSSSGPVKTSPVALAIRVGWGTLLTVAPGLVLGAMGDGADDDDRRPCRLLRVLGARHLLQAAAEWRGGATARNIGTGIDVLHASTDIGFACFDRRWRRAAVSDGVVTTGFVVIGLSDI